MFVVPGATAETSPRPFTNTNAGSASRSRGAPLIALPAISVVSMAMVARALSLRTTLAMGAAVGASGLLAGLLLALLGG